MTVLMYSLLRYSGNSLEREISGAGNAFANAIRVATGVTDEQRAFEQFEFDFMAEPDDLPEQEHRLNLALGLEKEPERNSMYYARGLVGAMHGRKKSIHRGGPDHDPIWGETQ